MKNFLEKLISMMLVLAIFCFGSYIIYKPENSDIEQKAQSTKFRVKPEDTYKYYPTEEVIHYGGRSPVIVYS